MERRIQLTYTSILRGFVAIPFAWCVLLAAPGCNLKSASNSTYDKVEAVSSGNTGGHIGVMCIGDLITSLKP